MLRLYTEFQYSTMLGTGQKVCGGWVVVFKPIIVFSLAKAEQLNYKQNKILFITFLVNATGTQGFLSVHLYLYILYFKFK